MKLFATQTSQPRRGLELRFPPVAVALCTASLMWGAARLLPLGDIVLPGRMFLAITCAASGIVMSGLGVVAFRRERTTVNPTRPEAASSLVHSGVYSVTRNPMYLGFLLSLCGWAVLLCHLLVLPFLPLFVLYLNRFQIQPEERALAAHFGASFTVYAARVRRWL